jgi:hypothetical protein
MRNWLGYNMARWMGQYASRTQYFELFLNTVRPAVCLHSCCSLTLLGFLQHAQDPDKAGLAGDTRAHAAPMSSTCLQCRASHGKRSQRSHR